MGRYAQVIEQRRGVPAAPAGLGRLQQHEEGGQGDDVHDVGDAADGGPNCASAAATPAPSAKPDVSASAARDAPRPSALSSSNGASEALLDPAGPHSHHQAQGNARGAPGRRTAGAPKPRRPPAGAAGHGDQRCRHEERAPAIAVRERTAQQQRGYDAEHVGTEQVR